MNRHGDWMSTYSGGRFWPLDPRADEIDIHDIAHALSMACRYAGHVQRFYSVAEHCVLLCDSFAGRPALQRWALLHDASEAYLVDVPRPLKRHLAGYADAEARVMAAVCGRYGLPPDMPAPVVEADNRILNDEREQALWPARDHWSIPGGPIGVTLAFWAPAEAEAAFLDRFDRLFSGEPA